MRAVVIGCLVLCLSVSAQAADTQMPAGLMPLLSRPDHKAALLEAAQAVDGAVQSDKCATPSYATTGEVSVLLPLRLDARGQPVAGVWKESLDERGCASSRRLNALTIVRPNGTLDTRPLLPGTTITDPKLQHDSVQYAAAGMGEMPPGCEQGGIVDTAFLGIDGDTAGLKPPAGAMLKPWTELWTLQACSKRAQVTMHFTPDANGTEIRAQPSAEP